MPTGGLSVQVGGFTTQTWTNNALRELRRIGYEPVVTRKDTSDETYELRIGPYHEREDAELVFRNLPELGFDPKEMALRTFRKKDGSHLFFITFQPVHDADSLDRRVKRVRSLGLQSTILKDSSVKKVRVVRVDHLTRAQAQRLVAKLKEKGFEPKILEEP